ncbi:MAG: FAD-dependent monooxygenase, partial [Rhodoferax sp.]
TLEWVSVYTFQCRRMQRFRHGRVFFVGDAAHQVSPFGARGANSGLQDTDNLVWKLKLVMAGQAPDSLLDTYCEERTFAADENLLNSTRSTDFITPKSKTSLLFRNAVLSLAREHAFARALVNSGRLSVAAYLTESRLNTPDSEAFVGKMVPGAAMDDAPMQEDGQDFWLLDRVSNRFATLCYVHDLAALDVRTVEQLQALQGSAGALMDVLLVTAQVGTPAAGLRVWVDRSGRFAQRYDAQDGSTYLVRPDQHVAARWK